MPRRHGLLRRHCGSLHVLCNAICARQACNERAAFATSLTMPCHVRRAGAPGLPPLCPATIEARGLAMTQSNISNGNGAHISATAGKR